MDIVLATVLLITDKPINDNWIEILCPTLIILAIDSEIVDPREKQTLFTQDLVGDLELIRKRNLEFANHPMLGECNRYPEYKLINDYLLLNRSYRNTLTKRLEVDIFREDAIRDAIIHTDQLYQVWDTIRDAKCDYYYVTVRRQALQLLRDLLGEEAFYSVRMPPSVPIWHLPGS